MILDADFSEQAEVLSANLEEVFNANYAIIASISVKKQYALSASDRVAPSDWSTSAPTPAEDKPYLWMKTITSFATEDGSLFKHDDRGVVVGVRGSQGIQGERGPSGVYTLADGETIDDAPNWAQVVVDPYDEPPAIEMVATFSDGTSTTFTLYGEAVM